MLKRIGTLLVILTASMPFLNSCDNNEDVIQAFNALVDVSNSTLADHKYQMILVYSTDGGTTFVDFPKVKKGDTYHVKVVDRGDHDTDVTIATCFDVDWSASDPQPNSVTDGVAQFTMGETGSLKATVTDYVAPYNATFWKGTINALEDYGSSTYGPYQITLTQDATNANKFTLDNFYDSGLSAFIEFNAAGTVKFPDGQTPGGKPITNSSGTFNQCAGTFEISLNYDGGTWLYHFSKAEFPH